jgi:hypothetical protein
MSHRLVRILLIAFVVWAPVSAAQAAHQLVFTTGYANSGTPHTGSDVDSRYPPVINGGGYAVGIRVDLEHPRHPVWISPSFLYWNNATGEPNPNTDINYFQVEMGGRLSLHTRTIPALYAGFGAGYSFAHGASTARATGETTSFNGDFPTASLHLGAKTLSQSGITLLGEASYHFGLDNASGHNALGPARAWLIQIGIGFDILSRSAP